MATLRRMSGLRELALGTPERVDRAGLARLIRLGSPDLRARAARSLGWRFPAEGAALAPLLQDPVPGVRRAAAQALALAPAPALREALAQALQRERCASPHLALAAAWVRCGAPLEPARAAVRALAGRELGTARGPRAPEAVVGLGPEDAAQALERLLGLDPEGRPTPARALREALLPRVAQEDRQALEELAALGCPEDQALIQNLLGSLGRRGLNSALAAMGWHGDPRWAPQLQEQLRRMDLDPGRGFAWRRLAATALGRIGLPGAVRGLLRAVEVEAAEHEGRPGAGLGIQYPVRSATLWALGELASPAAVPTLVAHLGDLHGSALGGFHLPAMGALLKVGEAARPALLRVAREGPPDAAANAQGVLAAL